MSPVFICKGTLYNKIKLTFTEIEVATSDFGR